MQSNFVCRFLLVSSGFLSIGVVSDKRIVEKGNSVLMFKDVLDNTEKEVDLYVNGDENPTIVVTFKFENKLLYPVWKSESFKNLSMDTMRNIWITYMDETYERKFCIQSSKEKREVELNISKTSYSQIMDDLSDCNRAKTGFIIAFCVLLAIGMLKFIIIIKRRKIITLIMSINCNRNENDKLGTNRGGLKNPSPDEHYPSQVTHQ